MTKQLFHIGRYDWLVEIFYEAGVDDAQEVCHSLKNAYCSTERIWQAQERVLGAKNRAYTFSNFSYRCSVVILGQTTCAAQFANGYEHERMHLERHICEYFEIDPYGEDAAYLRGDISQITFPYACKYLCDHCKNVR